MANELLEALAEIYLPGRDWNREYPFFTFWTVSRLNMLAFNLFEDFVQKRQLDFVLGDGF